jgi:hypothetical protein
MTQEIVTRALQRLDPEFAKLDYGGHYSKLFLREGTGEQEYQGPIYFYKAKNGETRVILLN